jgi:ribosomal protein S18 acetylase RimI-like enzyme
MSAVTALLVPPTAIDVSALHALLRDAVESNASIGFVLPLSEAEVSAYWNGVFATASAGTRALFVTRDETGRIVGSVQLEFAQRSNSRHRCELQKLLVLRPHRGRHLGFALMQAAESAARVAGRTLIVLDTSASGNALHLYDRCGYTRAGVIPSYATDPDGTLIDTIVYYKHLTT